MISQTELLQFKFLQFLENKDGGIRSSLIECQSLLNRKININPKYRVLMFLPCTVHVFRSTWYREVKTFRIFMIFVSGTSGQKEYCLSLA